MGRFLRAVYSGVVGTHTGDPYAPFEWAGAGDGRVAYRASPRLYGGAGEGSGMIDLRAFIAGGRGVKPQSCRSRGRPED